MSDKESSIQNASAVVGTIIAIFPLLGGAVYAVGHYILAKYSAGLGLGYAEFTNSQCIDTGLSFFLIVGIFVLLTLTPLFVKAMQVKDLGLISPLMSIASLALIMFVTMWLFLFARKGEWPHVALDYNLLVTGGITYFLLMTIANVHYNRIKNHGNLKESQFQARVVKALPFIIQTLRVIGFSFVIGITAKILFSDLKSAREFFGDLNLLYFYLLLAFFCLVFSRLVKKIIGLFHTKSSENVLTERYLSFVIVLVLNILFLYLVIVSYVYGPFIYLPAIRGGSYELNQVQLAMSDSTAPLFADLAGKKHGWTKKLSLVAETAGFFYVSDIGEVTSPREQFRRLHTSSVYPIDKKLIQRVLYEKQ